MDEIINTVVANAPWLITSIFILLVVLVASIIVVVAYALITGRAVRIWIIEIGQKKTNGHDGPHTAQYLTKRRDTLPSDLRAILNFIEEETKSRASVPLTDFDPPRFPHYAYWMLEVLVAYGFVVKERTGQRYDLPIYNYRLSEEYRKVLGRT